MDKLFYGVPPTQTAIHLHQSDGIRMTGPIMLIPYNGTGDWKTYDLEKRAYVPNGGLVFYEDAHGRRGSGFEMYDRRSGKHRLLNQAPWSYSHAKVTSVKVVV